MIKRVLSFLGPGGARALFLLLAFTGLASLILNVIVDQYDWVRPVQTLLALAAIVGAAVIVLLRLDPIERRRWGAILAPALGAAILAFTVLPQFQLPLLGGAVGWIVAGLLLFRTKTPTAYREAVRHLRRNELERAVKTMDAVIRADPADPQHYRFRAELLRVWGKLDRARRDYARVTEMDPDSALGFNGLAEVELQSGRYPEALAAAVKAAELAPNDWVAFYNLGMIQDRLGQSDAVIISLKKALDLRVSDARHRLLIHFYLARAYARLGQADAAEEQVAALKRLSRGLQEWHKLLASEQAETLRRVLGADIEAIDRLLKSGHDSALLIEQGVSRAGDPQGEGKRRS
ncbi:MAG: tetratricopeptide repeat protein [Candidatus Flexifilum sp.]|jgi:tetratricopeptide (TPR) repeat protein